jgi:hypothetical protein
MTTIASTRTATGTTAAFVSTWSPLALGDDGAPQPHSQYSDKSVQVFGTFGGASLAIQGSNNGTDWATLTDPQGNDLLITSAKIEMITEATAYIRPVVVGGDGTTSLSVAMLCKEAR